MLNRANDLSVSVVKWLATRNPKLSSWVRIRLGDIFVTHLYIIVLIFLSLFSFHFFYVRFFIFSIFSALFFLQFYSFKVYFKCSMQTNTTRILNFAFAIGFCLRIYNITIYFPFARYICLKNQFLSQNHLR